ncbi:MAG TPA: phosphodiesterase [Pseudolabrys sp.]|nr:phosphodiesterase [Pseudolabrys sp.]
MSAPVLIAQISDLHIKRPGALAYGRVDTATALSRCVAALNGFRPRPELVVVSGDLADTPVAEEYEHLKRLLAPLEIGFAAVPGNHDSRELMRAALPKGGYAQASGALNSLHTVGPLDLVLLDSIVPGKPHGELDSATLAWIDATLGSSSTRPALIFVHHPPFVTGIRHMDAQNLRNAGALADVLRRHPRARLVAAGHVHRATMTQFVGIPATICPAPNHAVALDLEESLPPSLKVEPPAFHLHAWFAGEDFGDLITHHVPIGNFPGPFPFFAPDGRSL